MEFTINYKVLKNGKWYYHKNVTVDEDTYIEILSNPNYVTY